MRIIDWFKSKSKLIDENLKIRRGKSEVEQKFNSMLEDMDDVQKKYTAILEKKCEQFDLYVKYQDKCVELANDKRDLKRQVAQLIEENNQLKEMKK